MKLNKLFTTLAAGTLVLTLAACGNNSASENTSKGSEVTSSKMTKKHHENKNKDRAVAKDSNDSESSSNDSSDQSNTSASVSSDQDNSKNYSVSSTTPSSNGSTVTSNVKRNTAGATMTATDARNIVKEHIGNQLNNRGIAGQSTSDLPSIDSVDGYTATQNGTNDWTISGNGHTYHVTANSVTGN